MSQYLGDISAYAIAVSQGYTGTEEEYAELMASYATVGQTAVDAKDAAVAAKTAAQTAATTATNKATEATTAATTATNKAAEAQADADAAALDASQALSAASTATSKATEATTAAATATSAKTDAVAANTAAQSAKTAAQTAQTGAETAAASVAGSAAQIETNATDIAQLKSELPQSTNLFDLNAVTSDSVIGSNGEVTSYTGWFATDYMPVKAGVKYYTGGIYIYNNALYDTGKNFLRANVLTAENYIGYFVPNVDGFFRGTIVNANYASKAYVSQYVEYYTEYLPPDFSYASPLLMGKSGTKAAGQDSDNLYDGSCSNRELTYSNGKENYSYGRISTDYIAVSGVVYYKMFGGKDGDLQYCFEYDANKTFIKFVSLSGKPDGYVVLDSNTSYVKFTTAVLSASYALPSLDDYSNNLVVTNILSVLGRPIADKKITGQASVRYNLFDSSVTFEKSYVESAIKTYAQGLRDTFYDFVMPMNADLHTISAEPFNMLTFMAESGTADMCVNLGDNIPDHFDTRSQAVGFLEAVRLWSHSNNLKCPLLVLRGNHDNNPAEGNDISKMIPDALYYNIFQSRTQKGFHKAGVNYGYIDFEQSKIRVVFIDSGDIYDASTGEALISGYDVMVQQTQFNWFCEDALNFSDKSDASEWAVITISHAQLYPQLSVAFVSVIEAFMNGTTASGTATSTYGSYTHTLTYDVDYTSQGSMEYICHVNGHNHEDSATLIGNTGRYDIDIACDNAKAYYYSGSTRTQYTRTVGTIEEHIMDTLCIDKANRKIYMKRLGVGTDREFSY